MEMQIVSPFFLCIYQIAIFHNWVYGLCTAITHLKLAQLKTDAETVLLPVPISCRFPLTFFYTLRSLSGCPIAPCNAHKSDYAKGYRWIAQKRIYIYAVSSLIKIFSFGVAITIRYYNDRVFRNIYNMRLFSRHFLPKGLYTVWFINRGIAAPFFKQEGKMRGEIDLYMKRQRQEGQMVLQ